MKAMFFLVSALVALTTATAHAVPSTNKIPYYGEQLYDDLSTGTTNEELKTQLHHVLDSFHIPQKGNFDQISDQCNNGNCYQQVSLGYDNARLFLLGNFYLVDEGNGDYAIKDVYCDKIRTSDEFGNGYGPAPDTIPDGGIVNTEHTWPQSKFTGRYNRGMQKSDMHHLFPTDNQLNSIRGNNPFGEVVKDRKTLKCRASRFGRAEKGAADVFEPPANHRGNVARALFYFSIRYEMQIDPRQEDTLRKWSKEDPIDEEEYRRNIEIYKMQGNRNPFIDFPYLEDSISDF